MTGSIELVAIGDRVEMGRYRLVARFRRALIFAPGAHPLDTRRAAKLASVVDESSGKGPINLVVRGADFSSAHTLEVWHDRVIFGGVHLPIRHRYDSSLQLGPIGIEKLGPNLRAFRRSLRKSAAARSLVFLIDENRERELVSTFEIEIARRFRRGVERLAGGELAAGAATIKGLGVGLTPSGDDFLAGFLLGLHALQTAAGLNFSEARRAIHEAASSENPFSAALLRCAAEGRYFERAKSLVQALFAGTVVEVMRQTRRLLAVGASSGADLGVGLFFALETCCSGSQAARSESGRMVLADVEKVEPGMTLWW